MLKVSMANCFCHTWKKICRTGGLYGLVIWQLKILEKILTFCCREYGLRGCHKVFSGFIWRWMQVAIEICWNPLDGATQVSKKLMASLISLSLPPPSVSVSLLLAFFFLFTIFYLAFAFHFLWRNFIERNHTSCGDWTPAFCVTDECLTR